MSTKLKIDPKDKSRKEAELPRLAELARAEHEAANKSRQEMLEHMRAAGQALRDARAWKPYGLWMDWVEMHFGSYSLAICYMNLAKHWDSEPVRSYRKEIPEEQQSLRGVLRAAGLLKDKQQTTPSDVAPTQNAPKRMTEEHRDYVDLRKVIERQVQNLSPEQKKVLVENWEFEIWPLVQKAIEAKLKGQTRRTAA